MSLEKNRYHGRPVGAAMMLQGMPKDGEGNPLLVQLAAAFGEEYALRTGD
jgi:hypothetical protein